MSKAHENSNGITKIQSYFQACVDNTCSILRILVMVKYVEGRGGGGDDFKRYL